MMRISQKQIAYRAVALAVVLLCPVILMSQDEKTEKSTSAKAEKKAESAPDGSKASGDDSKDVESKGEAGTKSTDKPKKPAEPEIEVPFKSQPYLVKVQIGFGGNFLPEPSRREGVLQAVRHAVARMYGPMWQAKIQLNDWMVPASRRHLEWLKAEDVLPKYPEAETHKVFFVAVEKSGSAYKISCRELDTRIQELTPVYTRETRDVRSIAFAVTSLLQDSFRPCVLYLRKYLTEDQRPMMELQVQAGELMPPDSSAVQVVENDILRPFVRQMDRRNPKLLTKLLRLDLSYVRVMKIDHGDKSISSARETTNDEAVAVPVVDEEAEGGEIEPGYSPGRIQGFFITHSPLSPFGGKGRRMQHFAVRQRPSEDQSKVRIMLRGREDKPLVAHRLALAYQLHWKDSEDGDQTPLVTDRNGEVVIQQRDGHPTFWIRVYSGASLLARVPYAPGLLPADTIELPDDSIRLGVEGEIQLLSDELVDAIAMQAVLMARARKLAEKGDVKTVDSLLTRYSTVPGKKEFLQKISNIRVPAMKKAEAKRLSPVFSRRLCDGLEETVNRFFDEKKEQARLQEISVLKATAQQNSGS